MHEFSRQNYFQLLCKADSFIKKHLGTCVDPNGSPVSNLAAGGFAELPSGSVIREHAPRGGEHGSCLPRRRWDRNLGV